MVFFLRQLDIYGIFLLKFLALGTIFFEEIVATWGVEGIDAIAYAAEKRFSESQQQKAAGSPVWWRVSRLPWKLTLHEGLH